MRSPICWFGGKGNFVRKLMKFIPSHRKYIEVFGGGASLLFAKQPTEIEVYNDIDDRLVNFFSVLKNDFDKLFERCYNTLYSRSEFLHAKKKLNQGSKIEQAYRFFILARMNFAGQFAKSFGTVNNKSEKKMIETCSGYLSGLVRLKQTSNRLQNVEIKCLDWKDLIQEYDSEDTFFYFDPPYVSSTRKDGKYKHELIDQDHIELIDTIIKLKGKVLVSGYNNPIYETLEQHGFIRKDFNTVCFSKAKTRWSNSNRINAESRCIGKGTLATSAGRIESLWMNYEIIDKQKKLF